MTITVRLAAASCLLARAQAANACDVIDPWLLHNRLPLHCFALHAPAFWTEMTVRRLVGHVGLVNFPGRTLGKSRSNLLRCRIAARTAHATRKQPRMRA